MAVEGLSCSGGRLCGRDVFGSGGYPMYFVRANHVLKLTGTNLLLQAFSCSSTALIRLLWRGKRATNGAI